MTIIVSVKLPLREGSPTHAKNPIKTYMALDDGVSVGASGELRLVSKRDVDERGRIVDTNVHIYADGAWLEANWEREESE